ncbi:MAG: epoxide hydrolase [Alphaproteobacteria bacterium]
MLASHIRPFSIDIPQARLADLRSRLEQTRLPDAIEEGGWERGASLSYMRALKNFWLNHFDWRAEEKKLNRFPQFVANVDGYDIHFIHVRGKSANPLPIVLTHGWPSSFAEFAKLIPLLTNHCCRGADPDQAFDVIVPSMPGYGFSSRPTRAGVTPQTVAELWLKLMTEVLGYDRFVAHGGDIGAGVTNRLGRIGGDHVIAIHAMATPHLGLGKNHPDLSADERGFIELNEQWDEEEGAYAHQQRTRPQTLAMGLNDSPIGLAAWIVEKWRTWSDCGGDIGARFSMDELLTNVSIYWFTETIGASMNMYYESAHAPAQRSNGKIETPARLFLTREAVDLAPREYAERAYANLSYGRTERGGHFLASEEPELLARELRGFFHAFR